MASSLVFLCLFALCPFALALPTGETEVPDTETPTSMDLFNSTDSIPELMEATNASTVLTSEEPESLNITETSTEPPTTDSLVVETISYTAMPEIKPTKPEHIEGAASSASLSSLLATLSVLLWFVIKA